MKIDIYGGVKLLARSNFTNRGEVASFLENFNTWWTILNSKKRFSQDILGNTVINGEKTEILRALADWIEQWCHSPAFTLTPQTASALTAILHAHAILIDDLLNEAYVITAKLQSDPVERHLS